MSFDKAYDCLSFDVEHFVSDMIDMRANEFGSWDEFYKEVERRAGEVEVKEAVIKELAKDDDWIGEIEQVDEKDFRVASVLACMNDNKYFFKELWKHER